MSKPFVTNVLSYRYDTALDYHVTMYDNMPYERDSDYCNVEKLALNSGRVLKCFLCMMQPEPVPIDNKDDEMEQYLLELKLKLQRQRELAKQVQDGTEDVPDGITEEQMRTLLDDQQETAGADSSADSEEVDLSGTTNPFADVEDW